MYKINCKNCDKLLYIECSEICNHFTQDSSISCDRHYVFSTILSCNGDLFCEKCIIFCKNCNSRLEKKNDTDDYCKKCFIKTLIKNTYNDITKEFPIELVDMILENV